nr:hypothetical protein [Ramlibacter sp. 2FC]
MLLVGCAAPQWEKPGAPRADVLSRLGKPTARYALPDGERLQYSQQPAGIQVHNLDFDATGRLVRVEQTLDPGKFGRIQIDRWTARDVELMFGKPALLERVALFDGVVWTYRYRDVSGFGFRRLHLHLDPSGVVRKWLITEEIEPEPREFPERR